MIRETRNKLEELNLTLHTKRRDYFSTWTVIPAAATVPWPRRLDWRNISARKTALPILQDARGESWVAARPWAGRVRSGKLSRATCRSLPRSSLPTERHAEYTRIRGRHDGEETTTRTADERAPVCRRDGPAPRCSPVLISSVERHLTITKWRLKSARELGTWMRTGGISFWKRNYASLVPFGSLSRCVTHGQDDEVSGEVDGEGPRGSAP